VLVHRVYTDVERRGNEGAAVHIRDREQVPGTAHEFPKSFSPRTANGWV
jgi:hypothetical protein